MDNYIPPYFGSTASNLTDQSYDDLTLKGNLSTGGTITSSGAITTPFITTAGATSTGVVNIQGGLNISRVIYNSNANLALGNTYVQIGSNIIFTLTAQGGNGLGTGYFFYLVAGSQFTLNATGGSSNTITWNGVAASSFTVSAGQNLMVLCTSSTNAWIVFGNQTALSSLSNGQLLAYNSTTNAFNNSTVTAVSGTLTAPTNLNLSSVSTSNGLFSSNATAATGGLYFDALNGNLRFSGGTSGSNWNVFDRNGNAVFRVFNNNNGTNTGTVVRGLNNIFDDVNGNMTVSGAVTTNGGLVLKLTSVAGNYTILNTDSYLVVSGNFTLTTPASAVVGQQFIISSGSNATVTLSTSGTIRLNGGSYSSVTINPNSTVMMVVQASNAFWVLGTNVVAQNSPSSNGTLTIGHNFLSNAAVTAMTIPAASSYYGQTIIVTAATGANVTLNRTGTDIISTSTTASTTSVIMAGTASSYPTATFMAVNTGTPTWHLISHNN